MILKKLMNEESQVKIIFAGAIVILLAILIPMFIIGHYNFFSVDDLYFAYNARKVWQESHSVLRVFNAQIGFSVQLWREWQGNFFTNWLMSSLLGICGDNGLIISLCEITNRLKAA